MDCTVHGVTKSQTRLSDFQFHFQGLKATPTSGGMGLIPGWETKIPHVAKK